MINNISYAGIGSRNIPDNIINEFESLGKIMANFGFVLRSGHATGSDVSFENGCDSVNGKKEIYIPWKNFNKSDSNLIVSNTKAFEIAKYFHPNYNKLSNGAKKLQARNSHQILGLDLKSPCNFVICYTLDGKMCGGTAQALRIANFYNVKIFNYGRCYNRNQIRLKTNELFNYCNELIKIV